MSRRVFSLLAVVVALASLVLPLGPAAATPVAGDNTAYGACGRVFPDPHAFWPSSSQLPQRSPFAKGNAACGAVDFLSYQEMVDGMTYLEGLFPDFVEFYNLEKDFADGSDCAASTSLDDYCSAGLPRAAGQPGRVRSEMYMIRVTDERVPAAGKRFFAFPLAIHGIERAGAEAGVRAAEDLATWAHCEALDAGQAVEEPRGPAAGATVSCEQEGDIPHPILETQPGESLSAGQALRRSAIYFIFPNPDGWRRGDPDNVARFYQRYNGNGVDMNRDWPTIGFTFRPYTPWSEPETRAFGKVLQGIRRTWDGGIDLHGQLVDRAFSFTLLGASQRDYAKNQRILQTVRGAWEDAEARLAWSPSIKPNDADPDDPRMYGVQWGTVWDTIGYTVTGALGDWIDSPLGLGADGIDNEMSFSHLINCGTGSCYLADFEQLHVDGNKSLVYAMVNFALLSEDTRFRVPGKVGYVFNPKVISNSGTLVTRAPTTGLDPQAAILDARLDASNDFIHEFEVQGPSKGVYNGGVEGKATPVNVQGVSLTSLTELVLERYRPVEKDPQNDDKGCGEDGDNWAEVNRYFNQSSIYLQAGQAVHANAPLPGRWRICMTGDVPDQVVANGGFADLDITFSGEAAWEDPGQVPYRVTNMDFFRDLAKYMLPGQLVPLAVDDILSGKVDLHRFTSVVVADDALPGFTEPVPTGAAQEGFVEEPPALAAATAPCAYSPGLQDVLPPSCVADYEFDVKPANNQQLIVTLRAPESVENDWDLYLERQSRITEEWFAVGQSATATGNERITILTPPVGHYRVRIVNWAGTQPPTKLEVAFSNRYTGPPVGRSQRTVAVRDAWGARLLAFVRRGGNLVLTDGAVRNLAYMDLVPRTLINSFSVYAGFVGFTRDGTTSTYSDLLARRVNQPGAAEGPQFRHQTYEPVPIGFSIQDEDGADYNASPVWGVDQIAWEKMDARTAGITTADQVTLGELEEGKGVVRVIGALVPMPTEQYYHPFGLASYAVTYSGYQVLNNALQWDRPAVAPARELPATGPSDRDEPWVALGVALVVAAAALRRWRAAAF